MRSSYRLSSIFYLLACALATAQTTTVLKDKNNRLIDSLKLPTGKTLTIESGGTLNVTGATLTGFPSTSVAWGSITGPLASQTDLQTALDLKASTASLSSYLTTATAASTYASLSGSYANPSWITSLAWSKLTSTPTTLAGYGIADAITAATAASTYYPKTGGTIQGAVDTRGTLQVNADGNVPYFQADPETKQLTFFDTTTNGSMTITGGFTNVNITHSWPDAATNKTFALTGQGDGSITAADVTGLATSATTDTTNASNITSGSLALSRLAQTSATSGQVIAWNGTAWAPATSSATIADGDKGDITVSASGGTWTIDAGAVTDAKLAGSITPSKITGTAAILGANTFTGLQTFSGGITGPASGTFNFTSNGNISIIPGGGGATVIGGPNLQVTGPIYLSSSLDVILSREAAGRLQLGLDSATPVSQQIKSPDGSGTNIAASNLTLGGSLSTGTGNGGDVITVTSMSGNSGTSANTTQERSRSIGRFVNLTEGTATNVASIALPSGKVVGGTAVLTVWASDGTDHQVVTNQVTFNAVNKAGTLTTTTATALSAAVADSSGGSLTVTYYATASGNNLLLRANATSSLTQTILRCRLVITALNGDDVQTVTPQ
jgi:hypothetical protein